MLRVYEQWRGISFLGYHFSAVVRGRKLCVLILVNLGSAFVGLCRFSWCVLDNLYLWYRVEGVIFCHEVTDALAEVADMYADIPHEGAACPSSHDNYCFRVHFFQIEFHGET